MRFAQLVGLVFALVAAGGYLSGARPVGVLGSGSRSRGPSSTQPADS